MSAAAWTPVDEAKPGQNSAWKPVEEAKLSPELQRNKVMNASPTQFEIERNSDFQPGFGGRVADFARSIVGPANYTLPLGEGERPVPAAEYEGQKRERSEQAAAEDTARQKAGRGLLYRGAAKAGSALGVNVPQVEQDADKGDAGGILGGTVPQAAIAAAPAVAEGLERVPFERAPVVVNSIGRAIERNAPTIGKVAGYGAAGVGAAERLINGHPIEAGILATQTPRIARVAEASARGVGRGIANLGHPEAPFAPDTGPLRPEILEGEYVPSVSRLSPSERADIEAEHFGPVSLTEPPSIAQMEPQKLLAEKSVIPTDTITADAGEVARRHMIGMKPTEPVILPRTERGLMLPDWGATVAPQTPSLPPRQAVEAIANEAVKGAGGKPELSPPIERGKPIYQRKPVATPATEPTLTPVESSALNGFHYDPATQTMTVGMKTGSQYRYAEVTPEEFQNFSDAKSKGKAYQDIKNNHVQTAVNYGQGWNATKPAKSLHSSETVPDLIPSLEESIRRALAKKAGK